MAERILRFHPADKVFHAVNAVTWFALLFTGAAVYFCNLSDETANNLMIWHIWIAVVYTFNLIGYLVFAPHRFAATLNALLTWDMDTIKWFRNFGGYPRRFFKIPFGPVEVPPQGRYNGGQKDELSHFLLHDVWPRRYRLDAFLLRSCDSERCLLVDVYLPCLGFHHLLVDGCVCSHPLGFALLGTLQGHLGSGRRHDLLRSCRAPLSEVA